MTTSTDGEGNTPLYGYDLGNRLTEYTKGGVTVEKDGDIIRHIRDCASDEMGSIMHEVEETEVFNRYEYDAWSPAAVLSACI